MLLTDTARFAVDDAEALVAASFACPYCLGEPSHSEFKLDEPHRSTVRCRCDNCDTNWAVAVNTAQALRLAIAPPDRLEFEPA